MGGEPAATGSGWAVARVLCSKPMFQLVAVVSCSSEGPKFDMSVEANSDFLEMSRRLKTARQRQS